MLFNSFIFIALVLVTFGLYYLPRLYRFQVLILIASSLIFYSYSQPYLVILLVVSSLINIVVSYIITVRDAEKKKTLAVAGVGLNLLILAFFKYSPLISMSFLNPSGSIGEFLLHIPLPIGISFYTFQGISLVVDVFKADKKTSKKIVASSFLKHAQNTLFFISFFPQLVAGPIVKAHEFLPQVGIKRLKDINWNLCFNHLVLGYFLKVVIADNLKDFTFWLEFPYFQGFSSITLIFLLFGYSIQIFADFAGYSLIAIGLARVFGYCLIENFNFPYISTSFKEFWKRWHISLSSFLMEYLYFPLGGNRKGKWRTYLNLMITMILGRLWHGAAWSYAIWGAFHGLALATERLLTDNIKIKKTIGIEILKGLMVFGFVTLAWLLFKLPNFEHVIKYFQALFENGASPHGYRIIVNVIMYSLPVIFYHGFYLLKGSVNPNFFHLPFLKLKPAIYAILLFSIIVNSGSSGSFIYFQF